METTDKYVIFKLDKEYYGLPIESVIGIEKIHTPTRVPNGPTYVKGVINLRGEVIAIIDLRQKLNMETKEINDNNRIIVVTNDDIIAGLIVDSSSEVIEIPISNIDDPPTSSDGSSSSYIGGIGKSNDKLIILLDLSKILEN